jgi:lysophospholipase L1-like esterase
VYRILVLGDSLTCFNKWPDFLEERLNRHGNYEVLNCAVNGWELYNYYLYLKHKGMDFEPDLVLIGVCLNDIPHWNMVKTIFLENTKNNIGFYTLRVDGYLDYVLTLKINPFLFRRSRLYRLLTMLFFSGKRRGIEDSPGEVLQKIKEITDSRICAAVFPYIKLPEKYSDKEWGEYQETVGLLGEAGIPFLDLRGLFESYGEKIYDFRFAPQDKVHFNVEGNRVQAEAIHSWLIEKILK